MHREGFQKHKQRNPPHTQKHTQVTVSVPGSWQRGGRLVTVLALKGVPRQLLGHNVPHHRVAAELHSTCRAATHLVEVVVLMVGVLIGCGW